MLETYWCISSGPALALPLIRLTTRWTSVSVKLLELILVLSVVLVYRVAEYSHYLPYERMKRLIGVIQFCEWHQLIASRQLF